MRPVTQRLSAAGFSPWVVLNQYGPNADVGLAVKLSSNGNLTYSVKYTYDPLIAATLKSSLTRVTTSLTVPITNHGLSVDDSVVIQGFGTPFDGDFAVASVTDQDNVVVTVANSGATGIASNLGVVFTARVFTHPVLAALTASADSNFDKPISACRLIITSYTAGYADLTVRQGSLQ